MAMRMGAKYKLAQLGRKAGSSVSLAMLLSVDELPTTGWTVKSEATMRPGSMSKSSEIELRAREIGSIDAHRIFRSTDNARTLTVRVVPMASIEDASEWVASRQERLINLAVDPFYGSKPQLVTEIQLPEFGVVGGMTSILSDVALPRPGYVKEVFGFVAHIAFVVRCVSESDDWTWDEVLEVATLEGRKIRERLARATTGPENN
jgi:hypothetical protein